jgi:hypothetical protein
MCKPARLKLKTSGIERLADRAGRDVEAWDLGIIREEAPSSYGISLFRSNDHVETELVLRQLRLQRNHS